MGEGHQVLDKVLCTVAPITAQIAERVAVEHWSW